MGIPCMDFKGAFVKYLTLCTLILLSLTTACQKEDSEDFKGIERQEEVPVDDADNSGELDIP